MSLETPIGILIMRGDQNTTTHSTPLFLYEINLEVYLTKNNFETSFSKKKTSDFF